MGWGNTVSEVVLGQETVGSVSGGFLIDLVVREVIVGAFPRERGVDEVANLAGEGWGFVGILPWSYCH
jgi:hypothetical protein